MKRTSPNPASDILTWTIHNQRLSYFYQDDSLRLYSRRTDFTSCDQAGTLFSSPLITRNEIRLRLLFVPNGETNLSIIPSAAGLDLPPISCGLFPEALSVRRFCCTLCWAVVIIILAIFRLLPSCRRDIGLQIFLSSFSPPLDYETCRKE